MWLLFSGPGSLPLGYDVQRGLRIKVLQYAKGQAPGFDQGSLNTSSDPSRKCIQKTRYLQVRQIGIPIIVAECQLEDLPELLEGIPSIYKTKDETFQQGSYKQMINFQPYH